MQTVDVATLTLAQAAILIRQRQVLPIELTQAYMQRIELLNPQINAYITVTAERALADAHRATDEIAAGQYRGPLHGVPIALKDWFDTAGIRTTCGARRFGDRVPTTDGTVARKLREAGSVLLGKLNLHELGLGVTTNNPHFGPTRNPWNLACIPGGSSGGAGAAMAAGLAAATMGNDAGGSIRIPAALCGVVGLKPSYGRVSNAGAVLPLASLFNHAGPLTRTVEDAALVLQVVAGYDPADSSTVPMPLPDYAAALTDALKGIRVGVPRGYFSDQLDDEVRAAVETALEVLRAMGATVREVAWPRAAGLLPAAFGILGAEAKDLLAGARPEDFGADVAASLTREAMGGVALAGALHLFQAATAEARRLLEEVDVLVTPTTPIPATPLGQEPRRGCTIAPPIDTTDIWTTALAKLRLEAIVAWMLPAWSDARVLYDRTGETTCAVDALRVMSEQRARDETARWYDGYLNALYRSLKAWKRGNALGGRLEAAESVSALVHTLFALERRWCPYSSRLFLHLDDLAGQGWNRDDLRSILLSLTSTGDPRLQQHTARRVVALLCEHGFDHVREEWHGQIERVLNWTFG